MAVQQMAKTPEALRTFACEETRKETDWFCFRTFLPSVFFYLCRNIPTILLIIWSLDLVATPQRIPPVNCGN